MDSYYQMHDDLETVIEKIGWSTMASDSLATSELSYVSVQNKLEHIIHSNKLMVVIIALVVVDSIVVVTELLFDLEIVQLGNNHDLIHKIFHSIGLLILSVFLMEMFLRLYVMRLSFFKHKMEIFDATIIFISFILDIVFRHSEDASVGVGLLIVLRLWRVTRIVNGIVMSVHKQARKKIKYERQRFEACEKELMAFQEYCATQEKEIERLQHVLHENNIEFVPKNISRPTGRTHTDNVPGDS